MKLFRNKFIVEQQKEFAEINNKADIIRNNYFVRFPLNLMKTLEMYDAVNSLDLKHWLIDMPYKMIDLSIKQGISPQLLLYGVVEDKITDLGKYLGQNNLNEFISIYNWSGSSDFINYLLKLLVYGDSNNDLVSLQDSKYSSWFATRSLIYEDKDYKNIFKYIALCLSGQLNPELDDFWSEYGKLGRVKVDYGIIKYRVEKDIRNILIKSVFRITCKENDKLLSLL